ncbi:hypothetical protein [Nocardia sp. XZ_19_369]|nr:hypothetical protein [Nocardia sp. XZ_19_369]
MAAAARWCRPHIIGEVEYREVTGSSLRHPSWRGVRADKGPTEVTVPLSD